MFIRQEGEERILKPLIIPSARERRERINEFFANVDFPKKIALPMEVNTLGRKLGKIYNFLRETLSTEITGDFDEAVANVHKIFSQAYLFFDPSGWSNLNKHDDPYLYFAMRPISPWWNADLLYDYLSDIEEYEILLEEIDLDEKSVWGICVLHWLSSADSCNNQEEKHDLIAEAFRGIMFRSTLLGRENAEEVRSNMMREAAQKRLLNDPKQEALTAISKHYEEKKSKFKLRGFTAQFVREMHATYPVITSIKTIENLVAKLNAKNELIPR